MLILSVVLSLCLLLALLKIFQLQRKRYEKEALLESIEEGVISLGPTLHVTYANQAAAHLLSLEKEILLDKGLANYPECAEMLKESKNRQAAITATLKPIGKPPRHLDAIAVPRGNAGFLLLLQDKTPLHKVIELGRDFIANASHELKTPITIIRGFAETLHDHPELSQEVFAEITEKIVRNCARMETLVKNLLTLAAIDEGFPAYFQECDLVTLAEEAKQTILTVHPEAEILVEANDPQPVLLFGDGDLLLQAILNLLDNSIKYSKPPARVTVRLRRDKNKSILEVVDQGIGIPFDAQDKIFDRFYAVDKSYSRSLGGSGLGLSIVMRIVEKHHGAISVHSELDKGTTFTLIFPVVEGHPLMSLSS